VSSDLAGIFQHLVRLLPLVVKHHYATLDGIDGAFDNAGVAIQHNSIYSGVFKKC
jgi:hypothetical protein